MAVSGAEQAGFVDFFLLLAVSGVEEAGFAGLPCLLAWASLAFIPARWVRSRGDILAGVDRDRHLFYLTSSN